MKKFQNRPCPVILCFTLLIALFSSCSTQSQSIQDPPEIQIGNNTQSIEGEIDLPKTTDTSLLLKFPSGIRAILEDSKGNIWFASHQEGVCLFDGKKLTYFTTEDGLSANQVRSIFEDSNGIVWFEGGEGISSYDGEKITTHLEKNYNSKNAWQSGKNDLWFKGDEMGGYSGMEGERGVYRYDGTKLNYHVFPITQKQDEQFFYSVSTPFVKGKNGMVWFGTYGGVIGYDGTSLPNALMRNWQDQTAFTIINNKSLGLNQEAGLHIRSIFEDSKGNLWIGNNGIGVLRYDGDTIINFTELQGLMSENSGRSGGFRSPPGSLEHVFSIGEDLNGNMWFGDRDTGAWRYDGKTMKNYTAKDGLTSTHIWQIYNTKEGELWFAMGDGNVLKFDEESFDRVF